MKEFAMMVASILVVSAGQYSTPEPWPHTECVGQIQCDSQPWGGMGSKRFSLRLRDDEDGFTHYAHCLGFATRGDYEAVERLTDMVVSVRGVMVRNGSDNLLVVDSVREVAK